MSMVAERLPCIFGEYALIEKLGQGAAGDVFLARPLEKKVAIPSPLVIKRLHEKHTADDEFVRRFRHEAEIAVRLDTPFVAKVYEVGQTGSALYIAMEYVAGLALNHFLGSLVNAGRYTPLSVAVQIVSDALCALELLHATQVIHRDVSPKNLMLGDDGMLRLIDLGFAKSATQDWKTQTGVVMGSLGYMPPEQITAKPIDARADLYSIGVVLFELLCVRRFIKPESISEMVKATLSNPRSPPSQYRRDVPPELDAIVLRATARSPDERYATAREFHAALVSAVPERPTRDQLKMYLEAAKDEKQRARRSEIARLIGEPLPLPEPEDESMKTTVYVERPSLTPRTMPAVVERDTMALAVSATALLPSKKKPALPTLLMTGAALLIGLVVGAALTKKPEPAPLAEQAPIKTIIEPALPKVSAIEKTEVVQAKEEEPAPKRAPARPRKIDPPVHEDSRTPAQTPPDADAIAHTLEARANRELAKLPPSDERAKKIQQLLLDLTMTRSLKDPEKRLAQLRQLEKDLEKL